MLGASAGGGVRAGNSFVREIWGRDHSGEMSERIRRRQAMEHTHWGGGERERARQDKAWGKDMCCKHSGMGRAGDVSGAEQGLKLLSIEDSWLDSAGAVPQCGQSM